MAPCTNWIGSVDDLSAECMPEGDGNPDAQAIVDTWGPVASLILWALTGRQFSGICTDKVTPRVTGDRWLQWLAYPDGSSRPIAGYERVGHWHPGGVDPWAILLPQRPVRRVTEVTLGGDVLDPSLYKLRDRAWLVRCDNVWPLFSQPCDDGFTVTYEYGIPAPAGGAAMAGLLACELARSATPGCECRLPARTQSVTQEGITQALIVGDPIALLDAGLTNIPEVDLWVRTLNPHRLDRQSKVLTPLGQTTAGSHHLRAGGP